MFVPVSKFLEALRAKLPEGNVFHRSGAKDVGDKWETVCHAVADFIQAARDDEAVGYDTARLNLHRMGHAAPLIDVEKKFGLVRGGAPAEAPTAPSPAPAAGTLDEAGIDDFVATLDALPTAADPFDPKAD
ncbi:hypothetical protein SEA_MAGUCO_56 [Arthrobacter phage MaGuCo]|uniref:Uncharacterized protein n=1 Tax=Arthrobacter phage MaGuCo TaxID=3038363 RepID=A0AAF0K0Q1_9CAUD|nr:hypothetical protein SEA_MAGUCO_56 [Arthrobacter phage MaGuCo]